MGGPSRIGDAGHVRIISGIGARSKYQREREKKNKFETCKGLTRDCTRPLIKASETEIKSALCEDLKIISLFV